MAQSKATEFVRRKARRPAKSLDAASQAGLEPASDEPQPWEKLERRWEHAMVNAVVTNMRDELGEVNYQLACQRLLEQRTTQEVADNLNLSPAQVRYRQHRVLKKVRVHLGIYTGEPIGAEA